MLSVTASATMFTKIKTVLKVTGSFSVKSLHTIFDKTSLTMELKTVFFLNVALEFEKILI